MKQFGESAIHDKGFRFYLTLNIQFCIEKLLRDMDTLSECMNTHKEWQKQKSWYNSKTTIQINNRVENYPVFYEFTAKECKKVYKEKEQIYNLLIDLAQEALLNAIEDSDREYLSPYAEDLERLNVIVDK